MKTTATLTSKTDLYERVTARILNDLSSGTRPWVKPWTATHAAGPVMRPLRHTGEAYRGVNVLLLWSEAAESGFNSPTWMTYRQALNLGGQVRRSETGTGIVYASVYRKADITESGDKEERSIPFLKTYTVFNADQIDGLPDTFKAKASAAPEPMDLDGAAATFFHNTAAVIRHGGDRAFYSPALDAIQLPPPEAFHTSDGYLGTKAHEIVHWTGNEARLNRQFGRRFGDDAYAFEELVAEIGAAFICADLGLTADIRDDHSAYISTWLAVLKSDKRAVFTAAAQAQRAVDYLHQLQQLAQPLAA